MNKEILPSAETLLFEATQPTPKESNPGGLHDKIENPGPKIEFLKNIGAIQNTQVSLPFAKDGVTHLSDDSKEKLAPAKSGSALKTPTQALAHGLAAMFKEGSKTATKKKPG